MKKVLVSLLVLALAMTSVFAAVNFSGDFVTGYTFAYDTDAEKWSNYMFGQDNVNTNSTKLNLGIADDNGIWSIGLEGELMVDGSAQDTPQNRVMGDITLDLAKLIMGDTDWTAQLQMLANDRVTALRAYSNQSGLSYDRVRTNEPGLWANAIVGYGYLLQIQIGGAPKLVGGANKLSDERDGDLIISAMTKPISGLAVSVDWALVGDKNSTVEDAGVFGAAAEVNLGEMLGLSFDLGVGVADKYYYGDAATVYTDFMMASLVPGWDGLDDAAKAGYTTVGKQNILAAQIYGGIDLVSAYVEYVNWYMDNADKAVSALHFGVDLNVVESLILNVYGGMFDLSEEILPEMAYYFGGNIGYELSGITFQVNVQYAENGYASSVGGDVAQGGVKAEGFSISPMLKLSF